MDAIRVEDLSGLAQVMDRFLSRCQAVHQMVLEHMSGT